MTPRDFEFLKLIGRGTFGRVFQVRKKDTKRIYAMKVLSKREIIAKTDWLWACHGDWHVPPGPAWNTTTGDAPEPGSV